MSKVVLKKNSHGASYLDEEYCYQDDNVLTKAFKNVDSAKRAVKVALCTCQLGKKLGESENENHQKMNETHVADDGETCYYCGYYVHWRNEVTEKLKMPFFCADVELDEDDEYKVHL